MSREQDVRARMIDLLDRLLRRTLDGTIRWIETDRDDQYLYPASTSGVTIERFYDRNDDDNTYQLTLLNSDGKAVQELATTVIQVDNVWEPQPWNEMLERLFDAARREALGIDELIDKTLQDVEEGVSRKDNVKRLGKKGSTDGFDDPWATTTPPKSDKAFDDEPPF
jgi:hypothetical protein